MLYLRDIFSIKCNILEQSQIILILAKQDLYLLSRIIVLFGIDRTLWTSSVLTELSLLTGLKGFSNSKNGLFLSNFITSTNIFFYTKLMQIQIHTMWTGCSFTLLQNKCLIKNSTTITYCLCYESYDDVTNICLFFL